ncbi:MAG: D-aminoacylase [Dehalococcoidia bacterium]
MFDLVVRSGTIYDGLGGEPYAADLAITGDQIAAVAPGLDADGAQVVEATGLAVAPGFINMLSHSYYSVLVDPRSMSELKQGVTTQIIGEGNSPGPLTPEERRLLVEKQTVWKFDVPWTRLSECLAYLQQKGTSQNFASFVGEATLRMHGPGHENRPATREEMATMCAVFAEEMADGALGLGTSLIYPPAFFFSTEELIELAKVAARYRGKYISHMRSESTRLLEAIDELVRISREAGLPAEIWHFKAAGQTNWDKMQAAIDRVEAARAEGLKITADIYPYTAGATGLSNCIPPWFHEGGSPKLYERLADPAARAEMRQAIQSTEGVDWENLYAGAGGPEGVLILGTRKDENRKYQGKTLAQVAEMEGTDPLEALFDLVARDRSRVDTAYFMISEDNMRLVMQQPWVSFGSDSPSTAPEGVFLKTSTHPRAYGCFARVLGRYVREEKLLSLPEAVRRMTSLPAGNLGLDRRGRLAEGHFADIVIFDPDTVADRSTYDAPQQYAVGVRDVIVNGVVTLRDGEFAGNLAGRTLYGPGRR